MYCYGSKQYALECFRILSETPVENVIRAVFEFRKAIYLACMFSISITKLLQKMFSALVVFVLCALVQLMATLCSTMPALTKLVVTLQKTKVLTSVELTTGIVEMFIV